MLLNDIKSKTNETKRYWLQLMNHDLLIHYTHG